MQSIQNGVQFCVRVCACVCVFATTALATCLLLEKELLASSKIDGIKKESE